MRHPRFAFAILWVAACVLPSAVAQGANPWETQTFVQRIWGDHPFTQTVLIDGVEVTVRLPEGWSVDQSEGRFVAPESIRSDCGVKFVTIRHHIFQERLGAELQGDKWLAESGFHSELFHLGGRDAVRVGFLDRAGRRIAKTYVNLPSGEDGGLVIWQFAGSNTQSGRRCQDSFSAIVNAARIVAPR